MSSTENNYVNTDLGNVALNSCGEYNADSSYEYLDTVNYEGGSYFCKVEFPKKISGIAPKAGVSTEFWQLLTIPGDATSEYIKLHDEVVNKAKQVETSRAAVELSQTEVEAAQADVSQMRQDTQEAAEEAASSRDSAAGYAQSAETSRAAAKESEDNINAQMTGFDTHVAKKISEAESAITEARRTAVSTVSTKQDDATQAVTDEGDKQMKNVEDAGTEQVGKVKSAGASAVSAAGAAGVSAVNAVKAQQTASIKAVADEGTQQVTAVNTAGSTQVSTIETEGADQVKAIQEAGENALQNISNGVDKGLSEEGKAADAKATGEAISKLTEDLSNKITKFYASNQGETHITDPDNGKIMDMMLYGKSEQKQYSGKNLLKIKDGTRTTRGVTTTAKDGVLVLKGTATETGWAMLDIDSFVLDGTYILSSNITTNVRVIVANKLFQSVLEQNKSGTLENAEASKVCFTIKKGETYDISNILIQIEKGSVATSYEPYTGGQPSPSPNYPQKIKSVVNPTVKVFGANILRLNDIKETAFTTTGVTFSVKDGVIKVKGTVLANNDISTDITGLISIIELLTLQSGKTYIYNPNPIKGAESYGCYLDFTNSATLGFSLVNKNLNKPIKLTDLQAKYPFILNLILKKGAVVDMEWKPQVLLNEVLLPYEPYKEQSIQLPITLNAIPVSSGGNVTINGQQYIADYVNVERGKLVKMVDSSKLDNTQSIVNKTEWLLVEPQEIDLTQKEVQTLKTLATYYPTTNISVNSEQLDGYTVFNYPISMANGWNYVKQQLNDNRDYIYDMDTKMQDIDTQAAEAYVNSEYAVALTELEV